jgi:hypothetical protein
MSRSNSENSTNRFYDRTRTAELLGESRSTVIRDEIAGRLTPVRFRKGGKVHYRAEEVEALAQGIKDDNAAARTEAARAAIAEKRQRPEPRVRPAKAA